jgi:hypothetical protein
MWDLFDRFFPEDDPKSLKRWRRSVGAVSLLSLLIGVTFIFAGTTGIPFAGSVAWGGEVDQKISESVKPLEDRMSRVESAITATTETTKILLAKVASDQIDQLVRRRCKSADSDEISYLSKEIRRYQDDYEVNRGRTYPIPTCEEVGYKEKAR